MRLWNLHSWRYSNMTGHDHSMILCFLTHARSSVYFLLFSKKTVPTTQLKGVYKTWVTKAEGRNNKPVMRLGKWGEPLHTVLSDWKRPHGKIILISTSSKALRCCNHLTVMSKVHKQVWYSTPTWFQCRNDSILMPRIIKTLLRL